MKRGLPEKNSPPAVGATEGRCTAWKAGANTTYGTHPPAGKRFSRLPVLTGNNSRAPVPGGVTSPIGSGGGEPPKGADTAAWFWPKRGGEVRMNLDLYK